MKRNKFMPINSKLNYLKKTKVQFSTRLSGCLGEHQSQEFFEKVNITRQSGICSKNKTNSFGDKRSHSFRQTLQLNVPFVANFSDSKQFCICYPVHFFRKKVHSYDLEDNRLASVRVYFPASRMKNGNDFKMSFELKKRLQMHPYQYEFVGYSSLLTLSLEDLSLAVFRAKSSSEKYKIASSLSIPKLLISSSISNCQTGSPIFIGTERIYSRILKLMACSQSDAFKLNNTSAINSDSNLHLRKSILKWIGLEEFLPPSSRLIFVRRVSSDSGDTLGASLLNSPGPKMRKSRLKEADRLSIRLKQIKPDDLKDCEDVFKDESPNALKPTEESLDVVKDDIKDNKRPRGRPKKALDGAQFLTWNADTSNSDDITPKKKCESEKIKCVSLQLKPESTSNSMTDSTSEEKYSIQLSSCTTPDTNKSISPVVLNGTLTTSVSSVDYSQSSSQITTDYSISKNKRGRPRKYPLSVNLNEKVLKNHSNKSECQSSLLDHEDLYLTNRKRLNTESQVETTSNKHFKSSNSSISSNDGNLSKKLTPRSEFPTIVKSINDKLDYICQSIWRPLKHPLPAPDPIVPFTKQISNTGLSTNKKLKYSSNNIVGGYHTDCYNKDQTLYNNFSDCNFQKVVPDSLSSENFNKVLSPPTQMKTSTNFMSQNQTIYSGISSVKLPVKDISYCSNNNKNQYLMQKSPYNHSIVPTNLSTVAYNNGLLSPLINSIFNLNTNSFASNSLASLFPIMNATNPNPMKIPSPSLYDYSCRPLYPNIHYPLTENCLSSTISHTSQQILQQQQYNQILLASKYDSLYPNMSWNNDYMWKY